MIASTMQSRAGGIFLAFLTCTFLPFEAVAVDPPPGFILGRVFEIDKEEYREYLKKRQASGKEDSQPVHGTDWWKERFLVPRGDVVVTGRQLEQNSRAESNPSGSDGDYLIRDALPGVYEFTLRHGGKDYPVSQRLGMKVDLGFVAELCFVIDDEDKVAWMVAKGSRREPGVPPWVPDECLSQLGACLSSITGDDVLPDGLILLLAGSAGAATSVGVFAADQDEASPLKKQ